MCARRMPWRRSASTRAVTATPSSIRPSRRWPRWSVNPPSICVSITSKWKPGADDLAAIAHLPAHLAVERRLVEHDDDRLLVVDFVHLIAELIVGDDADHLGVGDFERFVAEETAAVHGLFQAFERIVAEHLDLLPAARLDAVPLHLLVETLPIEGQIPLGGQGLEQFGREAVGLEHVGGLGAGDHAAMLLLHLLENPLDAVQPGVDAWPGSWPPPSRSRRPRPVTVSPSSGYGVFINSATLPHQLVQERLADAHLVAVQDRAAQQPADDVALLLVAGIDVFVDGERAGADVVGDAAQAAAVLVGRIVADAADLAGRLDQRAEDVDVEVRLDALQHRGRPLQAHARVDVLARQRAQVVRRIADAVELREDQVPNLDLAEGRVEIDFAARAADAVGPLAGGVGRPEVLVLAQPLQPLGRQLDLVEPNTGRLVVVEIDRGREFFGGQMRAISCSVRNSQAQWIASRLK